MQDIGPGVFDRELKKQQARKMRAAQRRAWELFVGAVHRIAEAEHA